MLFLFFAQDIHRRRVTLRYSQCPGSAISLAAFQLSTHGRFWVSPEVECAGVSMLELPPYAFASLPALAHEMYPSVFMKHDNF